jgi:hypothetical protein
MLDLPRLLQIPSEIRKLPRSSHRQGTNYIIACTLDKGLFLFTSTFKLEFRNQNKFAIISQQSSCCEHIMVKLCCLIYHQVLTSYVVVLVVLVVVTAIKRKFTLWRIRQSINTHDSGAIIFYEPVVLHPTSGHQNTQFGLSMQ